MFSRLFFPFALLQLALLTAPALIIMAKVEDASLRVGLLITLLVVGLIGTLLALLMAHWLALGVTRPLVELNHAVDDMAVGVRGRHVYPERDDEVGLLGVSFNRLSARLAERISGLEEDREQLRAILSGMIEGVVALDGDQRIVYANTHAAELLEFLTQAPVGRRLWEVTRQRAFLDAVQRALAGTTPHREQLNWEGTTQRSLAVHIAHLPGTPSHGAVIVVHDTSELRRLERLRQEFVANVSHELKTPLSVITACVETLQDGAVDDMEHRDSFLRQIASSSNRLHMLILDLLSLARIESGQQIFDLRNVVLSEIVMDCVERHQPRAEARSQTIVIENGDAADVIVWAEEEALDHILDNLLDNAVKYTPEGGQIRIRWTVSNEDVSLEVSDTGIGIPERDLPRIFERFYRVDKARSREMGGTGLGLSIVKHLAHALQGSVKATSRIGQGSTFTVRLPKAMAK